MSSAPSNSPARDLLRDLRAADHLVRTLEEAAPSACMALGGAEALLRELPGEANAAGFWTLDMRERPEAWEAIAGEQQAPARG